MDSEDEVAGSAIGDERPFASNQANKSRITDQLADQRRQQARTKAMKSLGQKTAVDTRSLKAPKAQTSNRKFTPAAATITRSAALQNINRRVDDAIARTPALKLSEGNIARMRWLVGIQSVVILGLVATLSYAVFRLNDKNIYVARSHPTLQVDSNGARLGTSADTSGQQDKVRLLQPMNAPTYTQAAVLSWATSTASAVMNFGFHNANQRLGAVRNNFTEHGWQAFITALQNSKVLDNIVAKEQVITAAPIGAAVIVHTTVLPDGNKRWIVQIPFMVTTLSGKETTATSRIMTMTITKVPPTRNLAGLGIDNWIEG